MVDFNPIKDTFLNAASPTTNYGSLNYLLIHGDFQDRSIFSFDLSSIPSSATFLSATLSLYYFQLYGGDPVGRTYWIYECTQSAWIELEATWNKYNSATNWATAGGDYVTTTGTSQTMPASANWVNWDVTALITRLWSEAKYSSHFLMKDGTETGDVGGYFRSRTEPNPPTLTIYTMPVAADYAFVL